MNEKDILIPEEIEVKVRDRVYQIGVLSLSQIIKLGKLLSKVLISSQSKLKELASSTKESKSNAQDLINILELLEEKDAARFFSIILKEKDIEFLEKKLSLDHTLEIVATICEHNKFDRVKKNCLRITNAFKKNEKST